MKLYIVSSHSDLEKKIVYPEIPSNFLTRGKLGDWQTPRIRLYENVGDALSGWGLGENLTGSKLVVYRAKGVRPESLIKPSITSVPYALVLDEWWYLASLRFEYLGEIEVVGEKGKKEYHYGPRSTKAYVYEWDWKEIGLKDWEKSNIMSERRKLFSEDDEDRGEKKKLKAKLVGSALTGAALGSGAGKLVNKVTSDRKVKKWAQRKELEIKKSVLEGLADMEKNGATYDKAAKSTLGAMNEGFSFNRATQRAQKLARKAEGKKSLVGSLIGAGLATIGTGAYEFQRRRKKKKENE